LIARNRPERPPVALPRNGELNFLAVHCHVPRCRDAKPYLVAAPVNDLHDDIAVDDDPFAYHPVEYKHALPPWLSTYQILSRPIPCLLDGAFAHSEMSGNLRSVQSFHVQLDYLSLPWRESMPAALELLD
jgi:hypothetical protein